MVPLSEPAWSHYVPISSTFRDAGLCCLGAGEQSVLPPGLSRRTLGQHALVLISEGTGLYEDASGTHLVESASWFWLHPGRWHRYRPDPSGWREHWVLFDGIAARAYIPHLGGSPRVPVRRLVLQPEECAEIFGELREATGIAGPRGHLLASALVHRLIGALVRTDPETAPQQDSLVEEIIRTAAEDLSILERARRGGVSMHRLREEVRARTGMTPHELVLTTRLQQAQQLLAGSDRTVARIAADVGVDDPSYFTRLFTRRIGISPREFRTQQRRGG